MLANTKQVREIGNAVVGFSAQWTDKTSEYNEQRRSVVWAVSENANYVAKLVKTALAAAGYNNEVKATADFYVRVIADLG